MVVLIIKLVISAVAGVLDAWGGKCFIAARRFIMPPILAVSACYFLYQNNHHGWWWGLTMMLPCATLTLAYKDFGTGNFSRACWLFVNYALMGAGMFFSGHFLFSNLGWIAFVAYAVTGGVLGGLLVKLNQWAGDEIEGTILGAILFFIH